MGAVAWLQSPWVIALASAACYALALVIAQLGLRHQSPLAGAATSVPTTALLLWALAPAFLDLKGFDAGALGIFAGIGLLFPIAVTVLSFQSNRHMGPNLAGALGNVTPLFAVLFAILLLGEPLTLLRAAGVAVLLAGVALLSLRGRLERRTWPGWALALPLTSALIRGTAQSLVKLGLARWPSAYAASLVTYSVSAVVILTVVLFKGRRRLGAVTMRGSALFGLVGAANGGSVLLLYVALARGPVVLVAPLVAIYPLFTLGLSAALLRGTRFGARLLLGVVATVIGVVLVLLG
jgi:drug/metabolite transporter (DMT)-like permease